MVGGEPNSGCLKEEMALKGLAKAIHSKGWMNIGQSRSSRHVWKLIGSTVSKLIGKLLPKKYRVQCFGKEEFRKESV